MTDRGSPSWARIDEVFEAAMARDGDERASYLDEACAGDAALRSEVAALLSAVSQAASRIGDSADALLGASGPLVEAPDSALEPGTDVGPYTVRRLLGRGGMGNVYAAVRTDRAITREVALKVVRSGLSSSSLARRLREEQRILGTLEHPHIARLYDAGLSRDGAPYLVMELVEGERIDRFVPDRALGIRETLALFDQVCAAVAYAHQRLVVHRDLKPANVLVDTAGRVRLLDFGISRLVSDESLEADALTRPGQLVFTPEYASPEQTRGEAANASMDVYALGVLLYELLTSTRPPWQRLVMTRASTADVERAMVPPSRGIGDPARARLVRGDLDVVILKALSPDPTQRYATVEAFREELARVREGFPILARRSGALERTWRAARRNPLLATAWGLAAALALGFVSNNIVQNRRVARERDVAAEQRDRARTTSRLLASLFERADPWAPGRGDTLRVTQVLEEGVARVNRELAGQPAARADLLVAIGRAFAGLGRFDEAQSALDTARALQEHEPAVTPEERAATLTALGNLARSRGRGSVADVLHRRALAIRLDSVAREPQVERAERHARDLAIALVNVGAGHMDAARFDSASAYLDSGVAILRRLVPPDSAALAEVLNNRATLAIRTSDHSLAARLAGEALAINRNVLGTEHPRVAGEMANLGFLLDRTGRPAEAEPLLRDALRMLTARLPAGHPVVRSARLTLGGILSRTGQLDEAERVIGAVVREERSSPDARAGLSITLDNYAGVLERLGRMQEARATYREALAVQLDVGGETHPGVAILRGKVADVSCRLDGPSTESLALFDASLRGLARGFPEGHPFRVGGQGKRAICLLRAGRTEEGEADLRSAFNSARTGPPALAATARQFGEELLAYYQRSRQLDAHARVRAQLDSIASPAPTPRD